MATVRAGSKGVLVIVDVQVGVVKDAWDAPRIIANVSRAVERARAQSVPVIWVQHSDADLAFGSPAWQWVPELVPAPDEPLIHKRFNSAFEQTGLEDQLARHKASHIVLAGAATNWCIRATGYAALERGYDLTLIEDGHTTESMALDDGTTVAAADVVRELNVAMRWLAYPGRTNHVAKVEAIDFAGLVGAAPATVRPSIATLALDVAPRTRPSVYPEPFASMMSGRIKRALGDVFGLTNFGVNLTVLAPHGVSALRHAHSLQDEFIYILKGTPTLHTDEGRTPLSPGMCAGFKAGTGNGHRLINESAHEVIYLEVGDRTPGDEGSYPDDDLKARSIDGRWHFSHKDDTPY